MPGVKYFNGLFIDKNESAQYPGQRQQISYLINCKTTDFTMLQRTILLTDKMKADNPEVPNNAEAYYQYAGFESKNYAKHNILKQLIFVVDSAAFKLTCGYEPKFD